MHFKYEKNKEYPQSKNIQFSSTPTPFTHFFSHIILFNQALSLLTAE